MSGATLYDYVAYAVLCKKHGEFRFMLEPSEVIPALSCPKCDRPPLEQRELGHGKTNRQLPYTERWGQASSTGWLDLRSLRMENAGDD